MVKFDSQLEQRQFFYAYRGRNPLSENEIEEWRQLLPHAIEQEHKKLENMKDLSLPTLLTLKNMRKIVKDACSNKRCRSE